MIARHSKLALGLLLAWMIVPVLPAALATEGDTVKTTQAPKEAGAYPFDYCIVSGEKLGSMGDPVVKVYDGREIRFCCKGCIKTFEKDKSKWMKKLDEAIISAQKPTYPLQTCVVSGEALGAMGEPVDYVVGNRLVRLCCGGCIPALKKNPDKYLGMIRATEVPSDAPESAAESPHRH